MITQFSHGRVTSSAPHLARGFTVSGAFFPPAIGNRVDPKGDQQCPRIRNAPLFRGVGKAWVIHQHRSANT